MIPIRSKKDEVLKELKGLTSQEVDRIRKTMSVKSDRSWHQSFFWQNFNENFTDPIFILLAFTASIYLYLGRDQEAVFMLIAVFIIVSIGMIQDSRSHRALRSLEKMTAPRVKVIRDGIEQMICMAELVPGDIILLEEGQQIPADGALIDAHDLSVNESSLTGESLPVYKGPQKGNDLVFSGTTVVSGQGTLQAVAVGQDTRKDKITAIARQIRNGPSNTERQLRHFVIIMTGVGLAAFLTVWIYAYLRSEDLLASLLKALTLAMSILPEEIPVAFTTFMALGAWKLMKNGILVKDLRTVESLAGVTVLCADKTGTLTQNIMELQHLYTLKDDRSITVSDPATVPSRELLAYAMWASEPQPYDAMEISIHHAYEHGCEQDQRTLYQLIREYPLAGTPPMMTHVYRNQAGEQLIAAKGAPEKLVELCRPSPQLEQKVSKVLHDWTSSGYRVLAVARASNLENLPERQEQLSFELIGLVGFADPVKENIQEVVSQLERAGVAVKILTGDNDETALSVGSSIGITENGPALTGAQIEMMSEAELDRALKIHQVFARMYPETKLRVIDRLKATGQTVAMTGDGVNDAAALKSANIGIAMGQRGTEAARQAAAMVLIQDDLAKVTEAIAAGRRIRYNIKKAISYIIAIHVPIILLVGIPVLFDWEFQDLLTPVHVVFLELIMGPTCSIAFENDQPQRDLMTLSPATISGRLIHWRSILLSTLMGVIITVVAMLLFIFCSLTGMSESETRAILFIFLVTVNLLLTLMLRSAYEPTFNTGIFRNSWLIAILSLTIVGSGAILYLPPLQVFFKLAIPEWRPLILTICCAVISVMWYEPIKLLRAHRIHKTDQRPMIR